METSATKTELVKSGEVWCSKNADAEELSHHVIHSHIELLKRVHHGVHILGNSCRNTFYMMF